MRNTPHIFLALFLAVCASAAQAQQQLTFAAAGSSIAARISGDGSRIAFQSNADLDANNNADGSNEIFTVNSDGSDITQLTASSLSSEQPDISADGTQVVFLSSANLSNDNPDANVEIFIANTDGSAITQLTDTTGITGLQGPRLSANGQRVVFTAASDLFGDGSNADASREVFAIDTDGANLAQLSDSPANVSTQFPVISADGKRAVYASNAGGNFDIYRVAADGSGTPKQLTNSTSGDSSRPSVARDGRIAFESSANLDGDNNDGNTEIFVMRSDGSNPRQLTKATVGNSGLAQISADGTQVVFQSTANLAGANADASTEVFIVDIKGDRLDQLTQSPAASQQPAVSANGSRVVLESAGNLTGNNPEGNSEIFVLDPDSDSVASSSNDGGFFCSKIASGCTLCPDRDSDKKSSGASVDPTLALLVLLAWVRLGRRRRQA